MPGTSGGSSSEWRETLYRTNSLKKSTIPGIANISIAIAGTQTISYNLSGDDGDIVQRTDRQYQLGELSNFRRLQLESNTVSIVTRSGKDGYSCYVRGNEYIFLPPDAPSSYTNGKSAKSILSILFDPEISIDYL